MSFETITLGDFLTLKRGYDLPHEQRKDGDVPIVSSSGITGSHSEAKVTGPGVVTGRYGTIGEVFYVAEDFWPLNTALYVQDFKGNDKRFTAYFLRQVLRGTTSDKAAVPGVNRNDLHARKVVAPRDVSQQSAIADILSAYDDLIENNRRRMALLEESARLLYREWFVHLRFPGHEHVPITDGVPKGWKKISVSEACTEFEDGDWIETKDQGGSDFRLLQISNIGDNEFVETGNFRFISQDTFRRLRCNEVLPGDILISRMPKPIGRGWMVTEQPWRMVTAVDATIARPDEKVIDPFVFLHHINSPFHLAHCEAKASGATRPRVTRKNMGGLPLLVPTKTLQAAFRSFAEDAHLEKVNLQKQSEQAARARDILLPRLTNGELAI